MHQSLSWIFQIFLRFGLLLSFYTVVEDRRSTFMYNFHIIWKDENEFAHINGLAQEKLPTYSRQLSSQKCKREKKNMLVFPRVCVFFWTMSIYITTLSLTKRPPIQLVGQDGKIADKKISPIKYLNLKQGWHKIQNLKKSEKSGFFKKSGFYYILDFFKFVFCATYVYLSIT